MMINLICYELEGSIFVDTKIDFKEIRFLHGYEKVKILEEGITNSKKGAKEFTKHCIKKYREQLKQRQ